MFKAITKLFGIFCILFTFQEAAFSSEPIHPSCRVGKVWKGECVCHTGFACGPDLCCQNGEHCSKAGNRYSCNKKKMCPFQQKAKGDVCACKQGFFACGEDKCCPYTTYCLKSGNTHECVPVCGKNPPCMPPAKCLRGQCSYPSQFTSWIYLPNPDDPDSPPLYCTVTDFANESYYGEQNYPCISNSRWVCPKNSTNSKCDHKSWKGTGISLGIGASCMLSKPRKVVVSCYPDGQEHKKLCVSGTKKFPWTDKVYLHYPNGFKQCEQVIREVKRELKK